MPSNKESSRSLATFHTHTGALKFERALKTLKIDCLMKPVPRKLSSSCGVCVEYDTCPLSAIPLEDVHEIFLITGHDYVQQYENQ